VLWKNSIRPVKHPIPANKMHILSGLHPYYQECDMVDIINPYNGHTGHWTKPGGGVYGVMVSGRNVAQMVLGYKNPTDFVKAMNEID
jgi:hypothetical protein